MHHFPLSPLLILLTVFCLSGASHGSDTGPVVLPIPDLEEMKEQIQRMRRSEERAARLESWIQGADAATDLRVLLNYLEASEVLIVFLGPGADQQGRPNLNENHEIRKRAQVLASLSLSKALRSEQCPMDLRATLFTKGARLIGSSDERDEFRRSTIEHFISIQALTASAEELLGWHAFFVQAKHECAGSGEGVRSKATVAVNTVADRILRIRDVPVSEAIKAFQSIESSYFGVEFQLLKELTERTLNTEELALIRKDIALAKAIDEDLKSREIPDGDKWIRGEGEKFLFAAMGRIVVNPETPLSEVAEYFNKIDSKGFKGDVLKFWNGFLMKLAGAGPQGEALLTREKLYEALWFFSEAEKLCQDCVSGDDAWVLREAIYGKDTSIGLLIERHGSALGDEELVKLFAQISSEQLCSDLLDAYARLVQGVSNLDPQLPRMFGLLQGLQSVSSTRSEWISNKIQAVMEAAAYKLLRRDVISGKDMVEYFKKVRTEFLRAEVLAYWKRRLEIFHDRESLFELAAFFEGAYKNTKDVKDPPSIIELAHVATGQISGQLALFYPVLEGIYIVRPRNGTHAEYQLTVMRHLGNTADWRAYLSDAGTGELFHSFSDLRVSGDLSEAESNAGSHRSARIELRQDRATGKIEGVVQSVFGEGDVEFEGERALSIVEVHDKVASLEDSLKVPAAADLRRMFNGKTTMKGVFAGYRVDVHFLGALWRDQEFLSMKVMGNPVEDTGSKGMEFEFSPGSYTPQNGILQFEVQLPSQIVLKAVLRVSVDVQGKLKASGLLVSTALAQAQAIELRE